MEIIEQDGMLLTTVYFSFHRVIQKTAHIRKKDYTTPEEIFKRKLEIIEELNLDDSPFSFTKGKKKQLIKAWGEVDPRFKELYKQLYPRGGPRKNAGRPKGQRTERTERLNFCVTELEKEYLINQLERYRERHGIIDKIIEEKQNGGLINENKRN